MTFARLAIGAALFVAGSALAQSQTPAPAPQPDDHRPGFLEVFGRWIDDSFSTVGRGIGSAVNTMGNVSAPATDAAKGTVDAARDAATTVAKIPSTRIVSGSEVCPIAANGAPDCNAAAERLCKTKGFGGGRSVDFVTAQKCPADMILAGRRTGGGACPLEHTVTKALCQ